jgi:polyhydroxyalkanoate synthase
MIVFDLVDQIRCSQGKALDALGLGPRERESRTVLAEGAWRLKAYRENAARGAACLLIPAPIKRAYIFDLAPGVSVVERLVASGIGTYLIEWESPGNREQVNGLAEYADRFISTALDAIERETGRRRPFLIGHSLGGTFAAIFSALHPDRVRGLVLLEAPLHFGLDAGALCRLVAITPRMKPAMTTLAGVPGSFLDTASVLASPGTFWSARWQDWLESLVAEPEAARLHMRVERWTLDEMPMPRRLFGEVVDDLYRDDRFMRGTLTVGGRLAAPRAVEAPVLSVVEPRSRIIPPASIRPFHAAIAGASRLLDYAGDAGVALQHVGVLVGKNAHRHLWPEIVAWIDAESGGR